jgi:C-terminal processing protease CtpA/Prc
MSQHISADGFNMSHKLQEINDNFRMLYLFIENPDHYYLKIKPQGVDKVHEISVKAVESYKLPNIHKSDHEDTSGNDTDKPPVTLSIDKHIGMLRVPTFMYPDMNSYKQQVAAIFKEVKSRNLPYLIVDLRGNKGGYPGIAAELLGYFIHEPVKYLKEPDNQERYGELLKPMIPKSDAFRGISYFLSDGHSLSSTGHFLALVSYHKIGEIVGSVPGGSYYCNDESKLWTLPNSKIQLSVAQTTFIAAVEGYSMGDEIMPDHIVKSTNSGILENKDIAKEKVFNLIEQAH